jgi:pyridoxamine 5'-phosphate oxidase
MTQTEKHPPFDETSVDPDPPVQFERWLADAVAAGQVEPTAMTLATVGADGQPSARVVLFKGLHDGGLTFYTNHASHKGRDLDAHPHCALVFWWDRLERQVRVEGAAEKLPREMAERYFHTRPRLSQLSALTSRQSQAVASRTELEERLADNEKRLAGKEVPLPESWGGYAVKPQRWEFWQGRRGRLHDRLVYLPAGDGWRITRLEP